MKWYFACNDMSPHFYSLIKGAVNSAIENTTLEPHFIYDGQENELTDWLKSKGVKIIHHRVSFYDDLVKFYNKDMLNIVLGAFLRCDIPIIEQEDEFVLYTDCDVLFMKDFHTDIKPEYFACSTQFDKKNFKDFNTGVMLMNVKKLRESHEEFSKFMVKNFGVLNAFDQTAYQIFYNVKNTKLPTVFNHKPYWGIDKDAYILHFHGPKPVIFTDDEAMKNMPPVLYCLYKKDFVAYDYYLELFKKYCPQIQYDFSAIEKLKNGVYPLLKPKKGSLIFKIKLRLTKEYKTLINRLKLRI